MHRFKEILLVFFQPFPPLAFCRDMNTEHLIQARYEVLMKEKEVSESGDNQAESSLLNKDMDGALDSFDNLFCRRCLVSPFDFANNS